MNRINQQNISIYLTVLVLVCLNLGTALPADPPTQAGKPMSAANPAKISGTPTPLQTKLPGQPGSLPTRQPTPPSQPQKGIFSQLFGSKSGFNLGVFIAIQRTYNEAKKTHNLPAMESTTDTITAQFGELVSTSDIDEEVKSEITHLYQTLVLQTLFRTQITEFTINFFITLLSQLSTEEKREKLLKQVVELRSSLTQESVKLTSSQLETQDNIYKFSADLTKYFVPSLTKSWLERAKWLAGKQTFLTLAGLALAGTVWRYRGDIEGWGRKNVKEATQFITTHILKVTPYELVEQLFRDGYIKEGIEHLINHSKEVQDDLCEELENNITGAEAAKAIKNNKDLKGDANKADALAKLLSALGESADKAEKGRIESEAKYNDYKNKKDVENTLKEEVKYKNARREERKFRNQYLGAKGWNEGRRTPKKVDKVWTSTIIYEDEYLNDLNERLYKAREATVVNIIKVALDTILEKMSNDQDKKKVISLITNISPVVGGLVKEISSGQLEAEAEFHTKIANLQSRITAATTQDAKNSAIQEIARLKAEQTKNKEANLKALSDLERQLGPPTTIPAIDTR